MPVRVVASEMVPPLWARLAPFAYLLACAACVKTVIDDRTMDFGVAAILVAVGLVPAFVLPVIFGARRAVLDVTGEGVCVDGRPVRFTGVQVTALARGAARVEIALRGGGARTFELSAMADAEALRAVPVPPESERGTAGVMGLAN